MRSKAKRLLILSCLPLAGNAAAAAGVITPSGAIAGAPGREPGFAVYRGIPYAAPPIGALRWRPPALAKPWRGTLPADRFAPDCFSRALAPDSLARRQSEDCLYLNIWTPARGPKKRPVMVWIYGGAFASGTPASPRYDGAGLNRRGAILVSFGYRTSVFGFLAHPLLSAESPRRVSGNYGLLDAIAALRWVRRNIAAFGGDPENVTIFGQSSGSETVHALTLSPLARGLFQKAIGESGGGFGEREPPGLVAASAAGEAYARPLGATLAALRARAPAELVAALGDARFEPVVDGWVLPADATDIYAHGRPSDVPLLLGSNADEAQLSAALTASQYRAGLTRAYSAHAAEVLAAFPADDDDQARRSKKALTTLLLGDFNTASWAAGQLATGRAPVWQYRFAHAPPPARTLGPGTQPTGAFHGAEIVYAFDNLDAQDRAWTATDRALAATLSSYWTNFARTGDPNGPGLPRWERLTPAAPRVLVIADAPTMAPRPNAERIADLARMFYAPGGVHRPTP